ncbi:MAG: condensation domain-containing protein [Treponema sp.]|jgi:NRPS condensation-like uncharacterized protein|nr:condensation domain-containing protein [Treponema sp.]
MEKLMIMNERLYLRSPSINVCFRLIVAGIFDNTIIEQALKKVCVKHPLLNCSIETDNDNNAWFVENSSIGIEYYRSDEMDWQTWYKKADNIPFDFSKGPLAQFCIIIGKNTEIIIFGHHIIGDGIGYLNLVKDILSALDNQIDITPQIPPSEPTDRYFTETVLLDTQTKSYAAWLNTEWRKNRLHFSEKDYLAFFEQYRKKYIPNLYMASLEGDDVKQLLETSKSNGLTVNEIIASAFSVAMLEILGGKDLRLGVAANIRSELVSKPANCMGNYVTGISAKIHYKPENTFFENAKNIAAILSEQLKNVKNRHLVVHFLNEFDKDLIESTMFAAYGNFDNPIAKKLAELLGEQMHNKGLGISNLGRHDFNDFEKIKVMDIQFIGPAFPANLLTVGVITVNNKINLCLRYNEGEITQDVIKEIYQKSIELINNLALKG